MYARFEAVKEQAVRALRDKSDLYNEGGTVVQFGPQHRFSVNTRALDITLLPGEEYQQIHLVGTNYREQLKHAQLESLKDYWHISLESENTQVYRAEYLAYKLIQAAEEGGGSVSYPDLRAAVAVPENLSQIVRQYAASRYREGYIKGVHDHDASRILQSLLPALDAADLLRFAPKVRALAQMYWGHAVEQSVGDNWRLLARSAAALQSTFETRAAKTLLA